MKMTRYYPYWPHRLSQTLPVPVTSVYENLAVSARRYPEKVVIHYYGGSLTYAQFNDEVEKIAGYLQNVGVVKGDKVLLFMQNAPQFMMSFYGILRANAVVVPLNLSTTEVAGFRRTPKPQPLH